jgi:uncharacterized membrane protein YqgA involved in biofilm formation
MIIYVEPVVYSTCVGAIIGFSLAYNENVHKMSSTEQSSKAKMNLLTNTLSGAIIGFTAASSPVLCFLYMVLLIGVNVASRRQ